MTTPTCDDTPSGKPGHLGKLTIHHDYEGGTTVIGTTKNSPAHHAIKANRSWTWSGYATAWLLLSSRHRRPKRGDIDVMERVLTELGYTVVREIDETMPSVEQQEADLAERMDARADRYAERAVKHSGAAAATRAKADAVFDSIPFGQPMLVDHYSYKADRNRRERAWNNIGKSIKQAEYADELARRSDTAAAHMGARHNPVTVGNRIEKLKAELRDLRRRLDGEPAWESYTDEHGSPCERRVLRVPEGDYRDRLTTEVSDAEEKLTHWEGVYAQLQADGKASTAGPDTVSKGDWVLVRGNWYRVRRVNKKTVTVPSHIIAAPQLGEREYTDTTPWHEVRAHRTTAQMAPEYVEAYETPGTSRLHLNLADTPKTVGDGTS